MLPQVVIYCKQRTQCLSMVHNSAASHDLPQVKNTMLIDVSSKEHNAYRCSITLPQVVIYLKQRTQCLSMFHNSAASRDLPQVKNTVLIDVP